MSIQTTIEITVDDAIQKGIKIKRKEQEQELVKYFTDMDYSELENYIEEKFYNYIITN